METNTEKVVKFVKENKRVILIGAGGLTIGMIFLKNKKIKGLERELSRFRGKDIIEWSNNGALQTINDFDYRLAMVQKYRDRYVGVIFPTEGV